MLYEHLRFKKSGQRENFCANMYLTVENNSNERAMNFPIVIVSWFCDLIIMNKTACPWNLDWYQGELYAASPISLLCIRKRRYLMIENLCYVRFIATYNR